MSNELPMILCCICGISMQSNDANMCLNCLQTQVDITEGISKQLTIFFCRHCGRYQKPPWIACELESRELLAICLGKVNGLRKDIKLIDAVFQWTEPHSKRIKVKLTVQKQVMQGAILQQSFLIEYIVENQQCIACQKSFTDHVWNASIQIRQKVKHKRTMLFLEQLLIKHGVCKKAMFMKEMPDGLDVYWNGKSDASKMLDFTKKVIPCRSTDTARKLISHDASSNTYNFKYTIRIDIVPICKDDLVLLSPQLTRKLGGISPLLLCYKVTNLLHMIDPITLQVCDISATLFYRYPFKPVMNKKQLKKFVVMDLTIGQKGNPQNKSRHKLNKLTMAEVECVRENDWDYNIEVTCHLGNYLKVGDGVLGYEFSDCNLSGPHMRQIRKLNVPEVVLVRKTYITKKNRAAARKWKLKHIEKEELDSRTLNKAEIQQKEDDYEEFLRDIEEDEFMRMRINLYKKNNSNDSKDNKQNEMNVDDSDDELPEITGLLEDTKISLNEDAPILNTDPITFMNSKHQQKKQSQEL